MPSTELTIGASGGASRSSDAEGVFGFLDLGYQFPRSLHTTWGVRLTSVFIQVDEEFPSDVSPGGTGFEETDGVGVGIGLDYRYFPRVVFEGPWIGVGLLYFPFNFGDVEERQFDSGGSPVFQATNDFEIDLTAFLSTGWSWRRSKTSSFGVELIVGVVDDGEATGFAALGFRYGIGS